MYRICSEDGKAGRKATGHEGFPVRKPVLGLALKLLIMILITIVIIER
jgi:hypothetical protein